MTLNYGMPKIDDRQCDLVGEAIPPSNMEIEAYHNFHTHSKWEEVIG